MRRLLLLVFSLQLMAAPMDDFVIKIKTDNPGSSANTAFYLPVGTTRGSGYNVDCDDDGTDEAIGVTGNGGYTCDYSTLGGVGTYTIRVKDNNGDHKGFRKIIFNNRDDVQKILELSQWGTTIWSSMANAFYGAANMTITAADTPDFSELGNANGASLARMFRGCTQLTTLGNANWDMSRITNMKAMFRDADNVIPDTINWDTSHVKRMDNMFLNASSANPDVSHWDTSALTNIKSMFNGAASFDRNISGWDISNITNAAKFLRDVQLTQANYDALLSSWGQQAVQSSVTFDGGTSQYCSGKDGRDLLLAESWSITDGGKNCGGVCASAVGSLSENQWTTISFPCSTGTNGIAALIGTAVGGSYGNSNQWVVYEQRGDYSGTGASMVALAATDPVEPGKGYWIIADHNTTWHIDGSLNELSYAPTVTASSLGISSAAFDYVHLRDLPDSMADQQKLLLGNPFPHDIKIVDLDFSHESDAFRSMDGNIDNAPYVNDVVYAYDEGTYKAISASTPGFPKIIHQEGFWLRLKPGQSGTNRLTYPKAK